MEMIAMELSIVMPAYNESSRILNSINHVKNFFNKKRISWELIVVDDGSTDMTFLVANKTKSDRINVIGYKKNHGKGYAIKYGVRHAKGSTIAFLDADLEIGLEQLYFLMGKVNSGECDAAIFSKNDPRSSINFPFYRKILSLGYYVLVKSLFRLPINDTQTGCKIFKRGPLKEAVKFVKTNEFAFDLELLAYTNDLGYRIHTYPVKIKLRREKVRINFKNIYKMLLDTIIIFHRFYILKVHKRW